MNWPRTMKFLGSTAIYAWLVIGCARQPQDLALTNPLDPDNSLTYQLKKIGVFPTTRGSYGLFVDDKLVYMALDTTLVLIDAANPAYTMSWITFIFHCPIYDVCVEDSVAYFLADSGIGLRGLGSSNFARGLGGYDCNALRLAVRNKRIYFGKADSLIVLDASNPDSITRDWWYGFPSGSTGNPCTPVLDGKSLFLAAGRQGLYIIPDVALPSQQPVHIKLPEGALDLAVADGICYAALGDSGIIALDVHDINNPIALGRIHIPYFCMKVRVASNVAHIFGKVAFVLGYELQTSQTGSRQRIGGNCIAVDVSRPGAMRIIDTFTGISNPWSICLGNGLVYFTDADSGLEILSLDPKR